MDHERLVADVDDSADSAARPEGRHGSWVVLDRSVVVAVLDFLFFFSFFRKEIKKKMYTRRYNRMC